MSVIRFVAVLVCLCGTQACVSSSSIDRGGSDQDAAQANLNLGIGYLRQGRPELALDRLERAVRQDPRSSIAHSTIAIAYDQLGRIEEAEEHYRRATQLEPNNPAAANSYAVFLCRQNRWRDAESYFRRAAQNPRYGTPEAALANAGVCARDAGERPKAEQYFRAALEKNPSFPDALEGMMELSYQGQNYLQTRAFMQRYLEVRPASASVLLMCYQVERQLDNQAAAERCARNLRERFAGSAELAQLNRLLESNGRE